MRGGLELRHNGCALYKYKFRLVIDNLFSTNSAQLFIYTYGFLFHFYWGVEFKREV